MTPFHPISDLKITARQLFGLYKDGSNDRNEVRGLPHSRFEEQ